MIDKLDHAAETTFSKSSRTSINTELLPPLQRRLTDKLQRLAEDIGVEMVDPQLRRSLTGMARRAQSEAQMVSDLVDSENDPTAVAGEFKEYLELWHPLARQIRQVDSNHALERTVFRISQSNREIGEFLRMPAQNDTTNAGYMMEALKRDVDEYFTRAPLRLVMDLPDARTALATAGEFYGLCEQFVQEANNNASQTELAESFRNVSQAWRSFNHTFRPMQSEPARRVLNRIEEGMGSLAQALQLYDQQFDGRPGSASWRTLCRRRRTISAATRKSGSSVIGRISQMKRSVPRNHSSSTASGSATQSLEVRRRSSYGPRS